MVLVSSSLSTAFARLGFCQISHRVQIGTDKLRTHFTRQAGGAQCALLSLQYAKLAADCFSAGPKQWLRILSSIYNPLMQLSLALWTSTRYPETYSGAATIQISGGYKLSAYTRSVVKEFQCGGGFACVWGCVCERPTLRHHNTGFIMSGGPQLGRMYHVVGCVRNSFGVLANEINGKF